MSPERVRSYWCLLSSQLLEMSIDVDELEALDPVDMTMLAHSLRAVAEQLDLLATRMPGIIAIKEIPARLIDEEEVA